MAINQESGRFTIIALGVVSSLTCLSFICLMIFGLITITNSPHSTIAYNVGAAEIVFAVASFILCMGGLGGMIVVASLIGKSDKTTTVTTKDTILQPSSGITTYA